MLSLTPYGDVPDRTVQRTAEECGRSAAQHAQVLNSDDKSVRKALRQQPRTAERRRCAKPAKIAAFSMILRVSEG
jgi:hypothetical protein